MTSWHVAARICMNKLTKGAVRVGDLVHESLQPAFYPVREVMLLVKCQLGNPDLVSPAGS